MFKEQITTRFNRASISYDNVANVQKISAQILVTQLRKFDHVFCPETILDLGTGTGQVVEELLPYYPNAHYTLNDIADNMINIVQNKFAKQSRFNFCISDMEYANFKHYDLIVSNFALQWLSNIKGIINKFHNLSKIFSFSCLLDGSFKEWEDILKNDNLSFVLQKYPAQKDMTDFLSTFENSKYHYEIRDFLLTFENAHSFMKYLQNLGASSCQTIIPLNQIKYLIKNYRKEFSVTYKVFFCIMKKL